MHDMVIRGGVVVDGTGSSACRGDVAIDGDRIVSVGEGLERGHREFDATGLAITPGWIDIHTHLDAQLLWDDEMRQSSMQGVTSVVMGNCGVGIAPVRDVDREWILDLLDGVEDISASALGATINFEWETFEQYLDVVDRGRYVFDVGAHIPHSAVRRFVMGERGGDSTEVASDDEIDAMAREVSRALRAGAIGVSTSRTNSHRRRSNGEPIGTLTAAPRELLGLASACGDARLGVIQLISDAYRSKDADYVAAELDLVEALTRFGRPVSMSLVQNPAAPDRYREVLDRFDRIASSGAEIWAQVAPRPIGWVFAASTSRNPLMRSASYRSVMDLPPSDRNAQLLDPDTRAARFTRTAARARRPRGSRI